MSEPRPTQLYELKIVASGEVRDADGNLISTVPMESTAVVTEAQLQEALERNDH